MHVNDISISYGRMGTKNRFQKAAVIREWPNIHYSHAQKTDNSFWLQVIDLKRRLTVAKTFLAAILVNTLGICF